MRARPRFRLLLQLSCAANRVGGAGTADTTAVGVLLPPLTVPFERLLLLLLLLLLSSPVKLAHRIPLEHCSRLLPLLTDILLLITVPFERLLLMFCSQAANVGVKLVELTDILLVTVQP